MSQNTKEFVNLFTGVDAKFLQYGCDTMPDEMAKRYNGTILEAYKNAQVRNEKPIFFNKLMGKLFGKEMTDNESLKQKSNIIVINIEKDIDRYKQSEIELSKLSVTNYHHLKATYWKNRQQCLHDLNSVMKFLKQFNKNIPENFTINEFSECSDPNIYIQDGPLACYISHTRAMMYGYMNFHDYTIIVEDDVDIKNTELIEQELKNVPDDWDIIYMNCSPKNISYGDSKIYKLTNEFHSTHFYIVKNSSFNKIFEKIYPVTDQIDVLISDNYKSFNFYNIPNTVFQRNISTNTQNNLYCIYTSPHYCVVRADIEIMKQQLLSYLNTILINNQNNEKLMLTMIFDIIYNHIKNVNNITKEIYVAEPIKSYESEIKQNKMLLELIDALFHFLFCTEKGTSIVDNGYGLVSNIVGTIYGFDLHNSIFVINNKEFLLNAYSYGSTCWVYTCINENDILIVKKYSDVLRWKTTDHDESNAIFVKELNFLQTVNGNVGFPQLISFNLETKEIIMSYEGESLFDNFLLPENWENQIVIIFETLTKLNIEYSEFNLKNILVKNNVITFVDFGLAKNKTNNSENLNFKYCEMFIGMLKILQSRLQSITDNELKMLYCKMFVDNIKLHNDYRFMECVY